MTRAQNVASTDIHTVLAELLEPRKGIIGADFEGYRNHCHRMVTFCLALRRCTPEEEQKVAIAACFHDIGLWTASTLDYLSPSVPPALDYLKTRGLEHWSEEVTLLITEHHKLRPYADARFPLVEAFRQADLVDFSLGLVTSGLSRAYIRDVKALYPNAGFHKALVRMASGWFVRHPLNPAPMMKW